MKKKVVFFFIFLTGAILLHPFVLGGVRKETYPNIQDSMLSVRKTFPQGYFVEPTDSVLKIAGNFGEIRPNHFHAGLDIKTGGREGVYIFSVADGYVSRIKISPYGYGKCLYITHPNGYVSVYAHLQRFYGKIATYVEQAQYKSEEYAIEVFPDPGQLRLKQRDTVAISGNTGGSRSPHLHFEIRDAKTENAYNPFLFGYKIEDTVPPKLVTLAVYPANDSSYVNGKNVPGKTRIYGSRGIYKLSSAERISVSGDIGFGLEVYDYANIHEAGKLGAYSIDLYIDEKRIYYHELNEISFDESRYINSHIDYAEDAKSNREIQKCFRDENNMLSIYQCVVNEGLFHFDDTLSHPVKFIVKDFFGNTSSLEFKVQSSKFKIKQHGVVNIKHETVKHFRCSEQNIFETKDVKVKIPPCTLYSDIDFDYSISKDTLPGKLAPVHTVHKPDVPLHANYSLSIKTKYIPEKLQSKATIVLLDGKNNMTAIAPTAPLPPEGGNIRALLPPSGGVGALWFKTETRYFGRFTVVLDTIPPSIKPYNIYNNKNMSRTKILAVKIGDNLTGIKSYRGTVDGKWIAMQYEYKNAMLFYEFDEHVGQGKHTFQIEVTDGKDNVSTYKADFVR